MRAVMIGLLGLLAGYIVGALIGAGLVEMISTNRHDEEPRDGHDRRLRHGPHRRPDRLRLHSDLGAANGSSPAIASVRT